MTTATAATARPQEVLLDTPAGVVKAITLTQTYIVENEVGASIILGTLDYNVNSLDGYSSIAFLCPTCGSLWGRIDLSIAKWRAEMRECHAHGGGSLLDWPCLLEHDIARLPRPLMEWEVYVYQNKPEGGN